MGKGFSTSWLHIQNAQVFSPDDLGVVDVLCWAGRIVAVGPGLKSPSGFDVERHDAKGDVLIPGLVDPHIHIMGASGGAGPTHRTPEVPISRIARAGITTVVSPLGTDSFSRTISGLVMRANGATAEGISAFAYTGGWRYPVPTLTGDPQADMACIDRVLGIKVAIAEATAPELSDSYLCQLAQAAIVGGGMAGKRGVLHAHIGDRREGLEPLWEAARQTQLPKDRFVATHVNRNPNLLDQAIEFAKDGGSIDVTSQIQVSRGYHKAIAPEEAIFLALESGVPAERITLSTDSGGAYPRSDGSGRYQMAEPDSMFRTLENLVSTGMTWSQAASLGSLHAADLLGLRQKGRICEGADADMVLILGEKVGWVWCRGRVMVEEGEAVVAGDFEG